MPSSSASTRDSWSEPLAPEILRVPDVGAILQEIVPSVSITPTTHNNCRVSMATFYKPIPPIFPPRLPAPNPATCVMSLAGFMGVGAEPAANRSLVPAMRPGLAVATPPAAIDFPSKPGH